MNAVSPIRSEPAEAFRQALAGAPALRATSAAQRAALIRKLIAATLARRDEIVRVVEQELSIPGAITDGQLLMIKVEGEFICKRLEGWLKPQKVKPSIMTLGKRCYVQHEPKGVVLNLCTWNAPYAIAMIPAFGAIAAGCPVVIKPSELAPASSALIAEIVAEACGPEVCAVVEGGADVAQALLAQPFNHVFYIGGHHVGKLVLKAAAENFASATMEMGGKNPAVVDASADLADAASKIAWGRLGNAGQMCVSPDYVLVHESVAGAFTEALGAAITRMYNPAGQGFEQSKEFGRIVNERHHRRIEALFADAVEKGATVAFRPGEANEAERYIPPTILTDVSEEMAIMQEEVFGPIITVTPYRTKEEIPQILGRRPKPLSSYIFARDRDAIDWFLANTSSGNSVVNHNVIQSGTNPHLPFGGVNASGQGRLGGQFSFLECVNRRSVVEEGPPMLGMDPDLLFPPYDDKYRKMIGDMLKGNANPPDAVVAVINGMVNAVNRVRKLLGLV